MNVLHCQLQYGLAVAVCMLFASVCRLGHASMCILCSLASVVHYALPVFQLTWVRSVCDAYMLLLVQAP